MSRFVRWMSSLMIVAAFALGVAALVSTPSRAGDNPCDPTFGLLRLCKAQHGRWDSNCCCCQLH